MLEHLFVAINYAVPFALILSILVFVHELGHYLVARWNGVRVEVFSIGFGPEIWGWTDRAGTRWKFCYVPLGGYVKMFGDADASSTAPDRELLESSSEDMKAQSLHAKTPWQRMAVAVAGPAANYLFTFLLFAGLYMFVGQRLTEPTITAVLPQSVGAIAGLEAGDKIIEMAGFPVQYFEDVAVVLKRHKGDTLPVVVKRGESERKLLLDFSVPSQAADPGDQRRIGIQGGQIVFREVGFFESVARAFTDIFVLSWKTVEGIIHVITGEVSAKNMGSALMIMQMSGQVAQVGLVASLWFMALLSLNLGLINLLPIAPLDGGQIVLCAIEGIKGSPLSERVMTWCFRLGFSFVIFVMILALWNDLDRFHLFDWLYRFFNT